MKNDEYVTRKELDSERRLTRVETSERLFRLFFSVTLAVLVAALIGIFTLLFELQDQVSEVKTDVVEVKTEVVEVKSRMDNLESRMDNLESRMDNIEIRMGKIETRLGNVETYLKLNGNVPQQQ